MKIARVFPRRTTYTPDDDYAFFGPPGLFVPDDIVEVFVSCAFTWDRPMAERLAKEWERVARVTVGGPAYGDAGAEFVPGAFLRKGMTITHRGCKFKCEYCFVPKREGAIRTLPIRDGNRLLDSNILACPEQHIRDVFAMLKRQKGKVGLHGGFDTRLIEDWHIDLLANMRRKVERLYVAFDRDTPTERDRVRRAIQLIRDGAGLSMGQLRCFVLCGYRDDTIGSAEERCEFVFQCGAVPFASYYRGPDEMSGRKPRDWAAFTSRWAWMPGIFARKKREAIGSA